MEQKENGEMHRPWEGVSELGTLAAEGMVTFGEVTYFGLHNWRSTYLGGY